MSYDVLYLDFHNPSTILNFLCLSDLVQGMEDLIELKRRKLDLEERKVHALERIATVLENQQINQHSPPLSISPVIKFHWNCRFMWAFLAHLSWMLKWAFLIKICPLCCRHCCCCRCRKLFIFSFSSPEPLGQFQSNLTQSTLG